MTTSEHVNAQNQVLEAGPMISLYTGSLATSGFHYQHIVGELTWPAHDAVFKDRYM